MRKFGILSLALIALLAVGALPALARELDKTAISPYENYCDGYGMPGAKGLGYISVLKVSTGVVNKGDDDLLDGIVAYDRAEANDAYVGQINMITASSFNGLAGSIWGYDLARAEEIAHNKQKPLFTAKQYDGSLLKVYDGAPLIRAGKALFGTARARRFPLVPGAHAICANKSVTVYRPKTGRPGLGQAYGVWSYIAISIAKNRKKDANLFIEDAGVWTKNASLKDLTAFLERHRRSVIKSIVACGQDQSVAYDRTYISFAKVIMKPGQIGTALTVAPYVTLAQKAVPEGGFPALGKMTLSQWAKTVGLSSGK